MANKKLLLTLDSWIGNEFSSSIFNQYNNNNNNIKLKKVFPVFN